MKRSSDRILATHVGSMARPDSLLAQLYAKERGEAYDPDAFEKSVESAVRDIVRKQVDLGIDIVGDGEQSKASFLTYAADRLTGFSPRDEEGEDLWKESRETIAFPEYYEANKGVREDLAAKPLKLVCTSPIEYTGRETLQRDIANLRNAADEFEPSEVFMTAISPSDIEGQQSNEYYESEEADHRWGGPWRHARHSRIRRTIFRG